ncbi:hypothetical protein DOY81_011158 [Sarcophaga bullata]|nr:hypothetical protein DOY81_011158 [Sarcophaga bullata]
MQNYFDNEATSSTLHATMKPARGGKSLVTFSTYEDRKEALLNTTMLDDDGTYRSKSVKINAPQQTRQQNDTLDNRESKHQDNVYTNIPKPPPLQMTNNNSNNKINNSTYKVNNSSSQTNMAHRLSNGSQNSSANDTYSRPNKMAANASPPSSMNGTNTNDYPQTNRQTLRLGTVTIGEYRQQTLRREPEKFDFITNQKRNKDSGDITPTNDDLQSELQNTLSRANLRKSNGSAYTEHQRNCPLHQQQQQQQHHSVQDYGSNGNGGYSVEKLSKKLQKSSLNESNGGELLAKTNNRSVNNASSGSTVGVGILKNGNGNRNGTSTSKSTEKSIKFG